MWHKWQNPTFTKDVQKSRFSLKKKKNPQKPLKKTNNPPPKKNPKKQNYLANNLKSLKQYPVSQ